MEEHQTLEGGPEGDQEGGLEGELEERAVRGERVELEV